MAARISSDIHSLRRLRALFDDVVDLDEATRDEALRRAGADSEERAALKSLIAADRRAAAVFDAPVGDWISRIGYDLLDATDFADTNVGPYRLVSVLGEGGSSVVYRAMRRIGHAEQPVALKLLYAGLYGPEALMRIRREQEILTRLSHPNIARLIDAGVTEIGLPYIAMELVDGERIVDHARSRQLDTAARLRLLREVCRAVGAAHAALVVHRDLKPSNVLVTPDGQVKVLDFGIAKSLDGDEAVTQTQHITLTPGYAAPEQYRSGPTTTAVDVYALGVLAGELLTGTRPAADGVGLRQARDRRRDDTHAIDAELLDMLSTALAAEPARRYPSAAHFADDIGRYLRNEPVAARRSSRYYRVRKFVARHRNSSIAVGVLALALVVTFGVAVREAREATREAAQAREELGRADALRDFAFDMLGQAEPSVPRAQPLTIADIVDAAAGRLARDRTLNRHMRIEMQARLAEVLSARGDLERARTLLDDTVSQAERDLGADDPLTRDVARASAWNAALRGNIASARHTLDRAAPLPSSPVSDLTIRYTITSAAVALKEHDRARALSEAERAVSESRGLYQAPLLREALDVYATALFQYGRSDASIGTYVELLQMTQAQFGDTHVATASVLANLARAYLQSGRLDQAEAFASRAVEIDRQVYAGDDWHIASHLNSLGNVYREQRRYEEAIAADQEALRIVRAALDKGSPNIAVMLNNVAADAMLVEDFRAALDPLRESLDLMFGAFGEDSWHTAYARGNYGYALALSGDTQKGIEELDHAIATVAAAPDVDRDLFLTLLEKRARIALDTGDARKALDLANRMRSALESTGAQDAYWLARAATVEGNAWYALREFQQARDALDLGERSLQGSTMADDLLSVENAALLALTERALGDRDASDAAGTRAHAAMARVRHLPARLRALLDTLKT